MNWHTVDRMIGLMSPTTLASFIADIEGLGMGADHADRKIGDRLMEALVSIVGDDEAENMITDAMNTAYAVEGT